MDKPLFTPLVHLFMTLVPRHAEDFLRTGAYPVDTAPDERRTRGLRWRIAWARDEARKAKIRSRAYAFAYSFKVFILFNRYL